jgi:4-azaleucine resistance transporter AzlC
VVARRRGALARRGRPAPAAHGFAARGGQLAQTGGGEIHSDLRTGFRKGLPFVLPTLALGISFGVLAEPVMGRAAPIAMSVFVFAGAAQFAALGVLGAGGAAGAAILAGLLMNARFLPMGFAIAPSLGGRAAKRALEGQAVVDASWAIANRGDGTFDRGVLIGSVFPQAAAWMGGTAIGVLGGSALAHPERFGVDAIFPAFFLALLVGEGASRTAVAVALTGGAITLALMSFVPAGLAVIAAALAALIGLGRR